MAFIDEFADWMNTTLTVIPITGKDGFGKPVYGVPDNVPCMVNRKTEIIKDRDGNELITSGRVTIAYLGVDPDRTKLKLGGDDLHPAVAVLREDENGAPDYEVIYMSGAIGTGLPAGDIVMPSSQAITIAVAQTAHGFSIGDWLMYDPGTGTWILLDRTADLNIVDIAGVVNYVTDANNFTVTTNGRVPITHGEPNGALYASAVPGGITSTRPSTPGDVEWIVAVAITATELLVVERRWEIR